MRTIGLSTLGAVAAITNICDAYVVSRTTPHSQSLPPQYSEATNLKNRIYEWRGQQVRYQVAGPPDAEQSVVLVHGLFMNSDHWRKTINELGESGYRTYALDLLGSGYSSKPCGTGEDAMLISGENGRFYSEKNTDEFDGMNDFVGIIGAGAVNVYGAKEKSESVLKDVKLGSNDGRERICNVPLRHPLNSCYNFYTWSEQVNDFTRDIVLSDKGRMQSIGTGRKKATLVSNSMGTIVSMQARLDRPDLYDGIFMLNPTFREMHESEGKAPGVLGLVLKGVLNLLRKRGHPLYRALAKPDKIRQFLEEPYAVKEAIDEELIKAVLDPLVLPYAEDVVFDTLSYTTGPTLEQQLQDPKTMIGDCPVWICYGDKDPWIHRRRVERLLGKDGVEHVIKIPGVGHCPHDEAPEIVNPLLNDFLRDMKRRKGEKAVKKKYESVKRLEQKALAIVG